MLRPLDFSNRHTIYIKITMFTSNLIKPLWVSTVRCGNKELTAKQTEFNNWLKTVSTKHIEYIADELKTTIDGYRRFYDNYDCSNWNGDRYCSTILSQLEYDSQIAKRVMNKNE